MSKTHAELVPQFRGDYTEYYETADSDSPDSSRAHLIEKLLGAISEKLVRSSSAMVLDIGSGKQILERELQSHPDFKNFSDKVTIITVDLADLHSDQLLANDITHIQATGEHLPFPDNYFDICFSSMAIDFMPRTALQETRRVIKNDGYFLANFHHPNLVKIAEESMPLLENLRAKRQKKVQFASGSSKINTYKARVTNVERQIRDARFIIEYFPQVVFQNTEEVATALRYYLQPELLAVEEFEGESGENGWFFAQAILGNKYE